MISNLIALLSNPDNNNRPQFVSFLYTSKTDGSTARYTLILGASYLNLLERSKLELELSMSTIAPELRKAADDVLESINKSIAAHKAGTQSDDYTKKGQYTQIEGGLNINTDNTFQMFGLLHSKVVLVPGTPKKTKSSPHTIAKNIIRKMLPISKFREFALDLGHIRTVRMDGQTLVIE